MPIVNLTRFSLHSPPPPHNHFFCIPCRCEPSLKISYGNKSQTIVIPYWTPFYFRLWSNERGSVLMTPFAHHFGDSESGVPMLRLSHTIITWKANDETTLPAWVYSVDTFVESASRNYYRNESNYLTMFVGGKGTSFYVLIIHVQNHSR